MAVAHLDDDELLIEFEVRSLSDASAHDVTEALKQALEERMSVEKENFILRPTVAHEAARKNPKREIQTCSEKIRHLKQFILLLQHDTEISLQNVAVIRSKLMHVYDRMVRISTSPTASRDLPTLFKACNSLIGLLKSLTDGEADFNASFEKINEVEVPEIQHPPEERQETNISGPSFMPPHQLMNPQFKSQHAVNLSTAHGHKKPSKVSYQEMGAVGEEITGTVNHMHNLTLEDFDEEIGQPGPERRSSDNAFAAPLDRSEKQAQFPPLDSLICKDPSTWNIKFTGSKCTLLVERFFYRVERLAIRSHISLNGLVDYMSVFLGDEALDWYWVYLERTRQVSWETLKADMIQRFQASRSDDDVMRLLNQRKQMFPKESFQEFYDAIQRIALQLKTTLSDHKLYNLLRRNMRPGLQLELHNTPAFPSLSSFLRRCVSQEEMWNRFGYSPESKMSSVGNATRPPHLTTSRYPRTVNELKYSGDYNHPLEPEDNLLFDGSYDNNEVCALTARPVSKQFASPIRLLRKPDEKHQRNDPRLRCWNCDEPDHLFQNCRMAITRIFCFGCGEAGMLKPNCNRCKVTENGRTEKGKSRDATLSVPIASQSLRSTLEEVACNTDPELYRRQRANQSP